MKNIFLITLLFLSSFGSPVLELNNFNNYSCDKVLDNGKFKTCYNYNYKAAVASYALLEGAKVNEVNIKQRFEFYDDLNIPKEFRTLNNEYTNSGFDRGHLQGDASYDYSEESLKYTYALSNIVPQYPKTNRRSYLNVEKYQRQKSFELNFVEVLTLIEYDNTKMKNTSVPSLFNVIIYNKNVGFLECYQVKNDNISYELEQMKINCSEIKINLK